MIPALPADLNFRTVRSVLNQTVPVETIVILPKKVLQGTVAEKVSIVLNECWSHVKIETFDYVLRIDGDVVLPTDFLEQNLKDQPDFVGDAGYAMVIKTSAFQQCMGTFHPESDDGYTRYKFMQEGYKVIAYRVAPILLRRSGKPHGLKYFVERGVSMWKLGYEPFHVLGSFRWEPRNVFAVFGYFLSFLMRQKKFDVAEYVWHKQVERLVK